MIADIIAWAVLAAVAYAVWQVGAVFVRSAKGGKPATDHKIITSTTGFGEGLDSQSTVLIPKDPSEKH
jgi:hypothetical protein